MQTCVHGTGAPPGITLPPAERRSTPSRQRTGYQLPGLPQRKSGPCLHSCHDTFNRENLGLLHGLEQQPSEHEAPPDLCNWLGSSERGVVLGRTVSMGRTQEASTD